MASAGQVRNWLDSTEARRLKGSIDHRGRVVSREEGDECRIARHGLQCCTARHGLRYCTTRHGLLEMAPYMNAASVRAWLSRSLRGNAPLRRTADTLRAAGGPDLLPDVVVYAGGALFLAVAGGVVFPSCSRGWAAGGAVPVKIAAGTAAAAAVAMCTTVATSLQVAGAAAHGASAADVLADGGPDYRRRVPPPVLVWPPPAWATANAWDGALLLEPARSFSTRTSPCSSSNKSKSPFIASMGVSFGKRGVKLFITMRLISRAGVVTLCLSRRCFLEYEDILHTTHRIISAGLGGTNG